MKNTQTLQRNAPEIQKVQDETLEDMLGVDYGQLSDMRLDCILHALRQVAWDEAEYHHLMADKDIISALWNRLNVYIEAKFINCVQQNDGPFYGLSARQLYKTYLHIAKEELTITAKKHYQHKPNNSNNKYPQLKNNQTCHVQKLKFSPIK